MRDIDINEDRIIEVNRDIKDQKIETFDDIARFNDKPHKIETFDDIRNIDKEKQYDSKEKIDEILRKTDPYYKTADKRITEAKKIFEERSDLRQEFTRDAGQEEHKRWQKEIIDFETKKGRIKGVDYDLEPALTHPEGKKVYPDYVDYKEDIIIDRKPIGKGENEFSVIKKYAEQRKNHIEAYEHTTGRKVLYYIYSLYPSPKDIY